MPVHNGCANWHLQLSGKPNYSWVPVNQVFTVILERTPRGTGVQENYSWHFLCIKRQASSVIPKLGQTGIVVHDHQEKPSLETTGLPTSHPPHRLVSAVFLGEDSSICFVLSQGQTWDY